MFGERVVWLVRCHAVPPLTATSCGGIGGPGGRVGRSQRPQQLLGGGAGIPPGVRGREGQQRLLHLALTAPGRLRAVHRRAVARVAMAAQVKPGKATHVPEAIHVCRVVPHKRHNVVCAGGEGEVEHEGSEQDRQHLLSQQDGLEGEQRLEGPLHLPRVRPPPPVARQVVRVRHHLQHGKLRVESHGGVIDDEGAADRQHYPQGRRPPDEGATGQAALEQEVLHHGGAQRQRRKGAGDEGHQSRHVAQQRVRKLADVLLCCRMTGTQPMVDEMGQLVELTQAPES
mmetsp:Transcript_4303/g.12401  ORF Transcript_4303/g.12401 Transcript_4303/m.12401 type:complete len:285 (+) Transcript_4303:1310-2164(+)